MQWLLLQVLGKVHWTFLLGDWIVGVYTEEAILSHAMALRESSVASNLLPISRQGHNPSLVQSHPRYQFQRLRCSNDLAVFFTNKIAQCLI